MVQSFEVSAVGMCTGENYGRGWMTKQYNY